MKSSRWIGFFAVAAAVVTASMSDAGRNRVRVSGEIDVPGVDNTGNIDFGNTGTGLGKLTVNTRSGRASATVRGSAPNDSGSNFRVKTRDFNIAAAILFDFTGVMAIPSDVDKFRKAVYRVSKRGKVRGSVRGRLSDSGLSFLLSFLP